MEATIVCVDNSEWTRNGDFSPDRFQAQADAVNLLAGSKMQSNPENGVGILTMAGKAPQVLVTPTSDLNKVLNCMSALKIDGEYSNIHTSVQVAQLVLKHRAYRNQRQRIVLFSASPVIEEKEKLLQIAKKLKKNNVAIDVVSFGTGEEGTEKLQSFCNAVQNADNCHFVTVPPGTILADALIGTPIFQGENAASFGAGTSIEGAGDFGVDPNIDPELALALRVSMEEERERQNRVAAEAAVAAGENSENQQPPEEQPANVQETSAAEDLSADQDETLQRAIAISMQENESSEAVKPGDDLESEEIQRAVKMSLESLHGSSNSIIDADFVNSVLESLPGVDPNSAELKQIVESLGKEQPSAKQDSKSETKDESKDKTTSKKEEDDQGPSSSTS